jgi:Mg2+ and Co2+ transporter CorA
MSDDVMSNKATMELDKYTDLIIKLDEANDKIKEMEKLSKELKIVSDQAKPESKFTFGSLFRDNNNINEKSIIGFISFFMMVLFGITDLVTGFWGQDLTISDTIYTSFVVVTLGSFGIAEAGKAFGK